MRWNNPYNKMPKPVHRDNKDVHNRKGGYSQWAIRVPSLKRNNKTWRNFYNLFPRLKGLKQYGGAKLKPWKKVK